MARRGIALWRVVVCCASLATAQSWRLDRARLCFVREEDNGAMNGLQSWIRVADYAVPVSGGDAVCLFVDSGTQKLIVTSTLPYDFQSKNTKACKSKTLTLELKPGENRTFSIDPAKNDQGYACGWRVEPITK